MLYIIIYNKCYIIILYYINGSVFRFGFRGKTVTVTKPLYRFGYGFLRFLSVKGFFGLVFRFSGSVSVFLAHPY